MLAKELIIQCLNCENAVGCWGLNRDFLTKPTNTNDIEVTHKIIDLEQFEVDTVHKFCLATNSMYVRAALPVLDSGIKLDIVSSIVCMTEALTNSNRTAWGCPPDREYKPKEWRML